MQSSRVRGTMDNIYGINVKNKFDLFLDEDVDPLEILEQKEKEKSKVDQDKKKKDDKSKKNKAAKKPVLKTENKNKPADEVIKPEKEGNASLFQILFGALHFMCFPSMVCSS